MKKDKPTHKDLEKFREFALSLPEAVEEFPFGHSVLKVNKKAFAFLGTNEEGNATIALKLPHSGAQARKLSCAQPTGYGLGKSGWVTVALASRDTPSAKTLRFWIEESYRAIAPKRLAAQSGAETFSKKNGNRTR
jgi:predicted DNA-binding protein (MmcQ/YjbR family)